MIKHDPESPHSISVASAPPGTAGDVANRSAPPGTVLFDVLKIVEAELQRKGLLPRPELDTFSPLWFLAETERNIYLWRRGHSIEDQGRFTFWVNVKGLITKRMRQLEDTDFANPFTNPMWGTDFCDKQASGREIGYLKTLLAAWELLEPHAHALSCVASLMVSGDSAAPDQTVTIPA